MSKRHFDAADAGSQVGRESDSAPEAKEPPIIGGPLGPLLYPGTTGKAGCDPARLLRLR